MEQYRLIEELKREIEQIELVDAHGHGIVAVEDSAALPNFTGCFSVDGAALTSGNSSWSLSFKRGIRQIAELYGCKPSLQEIEDFRRRSGVEAITATCFRAAKISALLIDDGIELDNMHNTPVPAPAPAPFVGKILRIEALAQKILDQEPPAGPGSDWTLTEFADTFLRTLESVANSLVALKSITACRTGLDINPKVSETDAQAGLAEVLMSAGKLISTKHTNFIHYLFTLSLEAAVHVDLPMQIDAGLQETDVELRLANPLHLRTVLEDQRFKNSRIVLLHASYPFSREASYLASAYPQIYLDFGLAAPKLSVHGMVSAVKDLLELAPISKVMVSTDGYAFPESFYLGARKAREVVLAVLRDACVEGDLSVSEAKEAARGIFAQTAIQFYKINQPVKPSLPNGIIQEQENGFVTPHSNGADASLVRILWVDTSGQCRCRVVPAKRFNKVVKKNGVGLTYACMAMRSLYDAPPPGSGLSAVGEIRLMPDLYTKCKIPWIKHEEMVLADMHVEPGEAWEYCPRETLKRVLKILKDEFNLEVDAGFESEFYLLKSFTREGKEEWVPFDSSPYCSSLSLDDASHFLQEVFFSLESMNVPVEQLHSEAGKGQFELSLGHKVCTHAANDLIFTREAIRAVAKKHGLLATFIPMFALDDIGSGSHVHLSLWKDGVNVFMGSNGDSHHGMSRIGSEFMAGVLHHLPAILAFTAPHPNSYDRLQPNMLSGAYQCWGKENREAPLRTAHPPGIPDGLVSNFEIKSFDAMANPYLGLAAIVIAGIDGLRKHLTLPDPIGINPDEVDKKAPRLPKSLSEAVDSLEKDTIFEDFISKKLLIAIKAVREAEEVYFSENKEAYKKLIFRY